MLFWCSCRGFAEDSILGCFSLLFFLIFWQKIGFVKHTHSCQFPSTTYQASFVWPHAFRLFMCAYNILCLCDCLSIVCETESSPLTDWRLFSLAEWWLSEKSGEKTRDEEWEGERVGECQKVRADGQKAQCYRPQQIGPQNATAGSHFHGERWRPAALLSYWPHPFLSHTY